MGSFSEAEKVLAECFKTAANCLKKHDPVYLIIMNNYGLVKKNLGKLEEAENILRKCQREGLESDREGARSWDNLTRLSNLALVLSAQGKFEMALEIFTKCLLDDTHVIGIRNPYTLTDLMNVGTVL